MNKYLENLFKPETSTYLYKKPKEIIVTRISEIFQKKVTLLSDLGTVGSFLSNDTFEIKTVSISYTPGVLLNSTLIGKIKTQPGGEIQIEIKPWPGIAYFFTFFCTPVFGLIYLYQFLQTRETDLLLWAFSMLLLGPILTLWFVNISIAGIIERFDLEIDKVLNK